MKQLCLAIAVMVVVAIGSAVVLASLEGGSDESRTATGVRLN